jgi:hypothetical protein
MLSVVILSVFMLNVVAPSTRVGSSCVRNEIVHVKRASLLCLAVTEEKKVLY